MGAAATGTALPAPEQASHNSSAADRVVVGRARERAEIAEWLRAAASGRRQIGFVSGEAGIGKTTLVDAVLRDLQDTSGAQVRIGRGQCVEHYGGGEPYLPVLEALSSLCRTADGPAVRGLLRDHAPGWLLEVVGSRAPHGAERADQTASAPGHTLHNLAASLEALAAERLLVLLLEDVHWTDYSTLDLLSVLAQRRAPARLLILCTLRPVEAIVRAHPIATVKRELVRKGLCRELLLGGLPAADVASYLAARFPGAELPGDFVPLLIDRSDGNPFFLVALVDHLLEEQLLVQQGTGWEFRAELETLRRAIPAGLRAVIEPRLERLSAAERRVLEAASVAGVEFLADAVAGTPSTGGDLTDLESVERICDTLARRQQILRAAGESAGPNGISSTRYAFRHALYQEVIYQGLSPVHRRRLHQAVGERLENTHRGHTSGVASELAAHFDRSGDVGRAVRYHAQASAHAKSRFAYQEAHLHLGAALALLQQQPESPEGLRQEISLLQELGSTRFAIKGYGDEDAARAFQRMRELAERLDVAPLRLRAMQGLLLVHTMRAGFTTARAVGEEMLALASELGNPVAIANTRVTLGAILLNLGELDAARQHGEHVRSLIDSERLPAVFAISSCCLLAAACAHLGLLQQARAMVDEALARAATYGVPYLRAHATNFAAQTCVILRDVTRARSLAEETLRLASEYGFSVFRISATMVRAWCDIVDGSVGDGLAALGEAFREYGTTGQRIGTTSFSVLLAEAHLANNDGASATQVLHAALAFASETGERVNEAELHRLRGESLLRRTATRRRTAEARACFQQALAIAAKRGGLLLELRDALRLCRIGGQPARDRLARLVDRFGPEEDSADLRAARITCGVNTRPLLSC